MGRRSTAQINLCCCTDRSAGDLLKLISIRSRHYEGSYVGIRIDAYVGSVGFANVQKKRKMCKKNFGTFLNYFLNFKEKEERNQNITVSWVILHTS